MKLIHDAEPHTDTAQINPKAIFILEGVLSLCAFLTGGWKEFADFWLEEFETWRSVGLACNPKNVVTTYKIEQAKLKVIEQFVEEGLDDISVHDLQVEGPLHYEGLKEFRTAQKHLEANCAVGRLEKIGRNYYRIRVKSRRTPWNSFMALTAFL